MSPGSTPGSRPTKPRPAKSRERPINTMVQLKPHPRPEQRTLLAPCTTSSPAAVIDGAQLTRPVDMADRYPAPSLALSTSAECALATSTPQRPYAGVGGDVVAELRADEVHQFDAAAIRTLLATPMCDPAEDPQPITALLDRARYVMGTRERQQREIFEEDRVRREDTAAAYWTDEALGRYTAEKVTAILDMVATQPELAHRHAFLMQLAPVVAQLQLADRTPCGDWLAQLAETRFAADEIAEVSAR